MRYWNFAKGPGLIFEYLAGVPRLVLRDASRSTASGVDLVDRALSRAGRSIFGWAGSGPLCTRTVSATMAMCANTARCRRCEAASEGGSGYGRRSGPAIERRGSLGPPSKTAPSNALSSRSEGHFLERLRNATRFPLLAHHARPPALPLASGEVVTDMYVMFDDVHVRATEHACQGYCSGGRHAVMMTPPGRSLGKKKQA